MSLAQESHLSEWAEPFPGANYLRQTLAVAEADVRKLVHDPIELFTRMVQPVLWLLIFGQVFNRTRAIPTGGISYLDFMAPGILAQSVLFGAIFYGISLDLGARPGHRPEISGEPRAAEHAGARACNFLDRSQPVPDGICVSPVLSPAHPASIRSTCAGGRRAGRDARIGDFLDVLPDRRVHREVARTLHGDWTGADDAALLREQRHLSVDPDAVVAAAPCPN